MSWYENEAPSEITVAELNNLCLKFKEIKDEVTLLEGKIKELNKEKSKIEQKIMAHLEEHGMKNFQGEFGRVSVSKRFSAKMPQDTAKRNEFFQYLKDNGHFDAMITVHSATLNSYLKNELEKMTEEQQEKWKPPGIDEIGYIERLSLRK